MRRFSLRNSIGEVRSLNLENGLFLSNPQGLGVSRTYAFADGENGFFTFVQDTRDTRQQITGDLIFMENAYAEYLSLIQWMQETDVMEFVYQPEGTAYYRKVSLSSISKSELQQGRYLSCQIVWNCLTPWYRENPVSVDLSFESTEAVKTYAYAYPYKYRQSNVAGSIELVSEGQIDGALRIVLHGPCNDPSIMLRDMAGTLIGRMTLDVTLTSSDTLELSTLPMEESLRINGVDRCDLLDPSENVFVRLPHGMPCYLTVDTEAGDGCSARVFAYDYYRGV